MPDEAEEERAKAIREQRIANLKPWPKGVSGCPGGMPQWRKALQRQVGDAKHVWRNLYRLAAGYEVEIFDSKGFRIGQVRPTGDIMLRAAHELLDRYIGKAVQAVVIDQETGERPDIPREALTADDLKALRSIAARLLDSATGRVTLEAEVVESIEADVHNTPEQPPASVGESGATFAPQDQELPTPPGSSEAKSPESQGLSALGSDKEHYVKSSG